jgi:glutamate/tyrosine decarboxylase-like PLP-dependent enzyme
MISGDIHLSRAMARAVERRADLELVTQALSITTFRYVPADLRSRHDEPRIAEYLDTLNRELLGVLQRGGEVFVSNAVVRGQFVLRACIVNFHTTSEDVEAVPEIVGRLGAELDARMRRQLLHGAD